MNNLLRHFLITLLMLLPCAADGMAFNKELADSIRSLDATISQKKHYSDIKEDKIALLKNQLRKASSSQDKYKLNIQLYDEYKAYQYDSAYNYANNSLKLARQLENADYQLESKCAVIFCLLSAGLYNEAFDELHKIDLAGVSTPYRKIFYALAIRLNYSIADYNHTIPFYEGYVSTGNAYTDSILKLIPQTAQEHTFYEAQRLMKNREYGKSIPMFNTLLKSDSTTTHEKAIIFSSVGWMHWLNGDTEAGILNLIESAKCDIKASVKETTALCGLGEILYNSGDVDHANEYVNLSLEDANFYGARQRKIEINNILPIIEQERYTLLQRQRNIVIVGSIIILALVVALSFSLYVVSSQKKKIEEARHQIEERNVILTETNRQLYEASKIKNEYIGNSFYQSACFIDKIDKVYKTVSNKIAARQFSDASAYLKDTMIKEERDNISNTFDKTFLKIFPDFVAQYNSLFPEEERKYPGQSDTLTTEMRIFALIRLGVTDSERIAQFLRKSVNTINTYKTRVKNKSLVANDQFEPTIMKIGKVEV